MSDINEMNEGLKWYVAHTYSGYENKVKANLEKIVENRGLGDGFHRDSDVKNQMSEISVLDNLFEIGFHLVFVA